MNKEFMIPVQIQQLIEDDGKHFFVQKKYKVQELSETSLNNFIEEISNSLKKGNSKNIIQQEVFDKIFSLLEKLSSIQYESAIERIFEILHVSFSSLLEKVTEMLKENEIHELVEYRNAIKMHVFFIHWFYTSSKSLSSKTKPMTKSIGKSKSKTKKNETSVSNWESDTYKERILSHMLNLLELDLSKIWKAHQPEVEFVNLFSNMCRFMLENPNTAKSKGIKRCVSMIFSILVKKYNHLVVVTATMVELLHQYEHLPQTLVEILVTLVNEHSISQIIGGVLKEIGRIDVKAETTGVKNIATCVPELAKALPHHIVPFLSLLLPHLDKEPYNMRSAVIQTLGNILLKVYEEKDEESNLKNSNAIQQLFDILEERFRDVNAFTRSKVIQTWQELCQNRVLPLDRLENVTNLTVGRIKDKSSIVRKNALILLSNLLDYNPFGPSLKLSEFKAKLKEYQESHLNREKSDSLKDPENRLNLAISFIESIHSSIPITCQLLGSRTSTDVLETISFFVTAKSFEIENAQKGVNKMLMLAVNKEKEIKEGVLDAFKKLYLIEGQPPKQTAIKLIQLTKTASLGELTALEELLTEIEKSHSIPSLVIQCLWDFFGSKKIPNRDISDCRGALIILSMLANANPEMIRDKVKTLIKVGFGPDAKDDPYLARYTCIALQKLALTPKEADKKDKDAEKEKEKGKDKEKKKEKSHKNNYEFVRFKPNHPLFSKLCDLIKNRGLPNTIWYSAAEQAINAIYVLSENPDHICGDIVKEFATIIFPALDNNSSSMDVSNDSCSVEDLCKLFFIVGHVALKQLVHIEAIHSELKKRRSKDSEMKDKTKKKTAIEEELGVAQAEETEVESLQEKAEKDIVSKNLLGLFGPSIALVCANSGKKFNDPNLRTCAVLALCKFMCISSEFCEKHLQLLFTILKTAPESTLRSNIVITLGDLAFRFPNQIEPWLPSFCEKLHDEDPLVKKNTLLVLTHLIANDMIRIRAQMSEVAICLEDSDSRISDLAKLFFHELSRKGKSQEIYNILPDIIGNLSTNPRVDENSFKGITKYLFSFIEKEKQAETLVQKLCERLERSEPSHWLGLCHCLSLLNYNEKTLKKLEEFSKSWQDKLENEDIRNCFITIINKTKKFIKPETKELLNQLERKINGSGGEHEGDAFDEQAKISAKKPTVATRRKRTTTKKSTASKSSGKKKGPAKRKRGKKVSSEESEEDQYSSSEEDVQPQKKKVKQTKPLSSEEESNEEEQPSKPTKKVAQKKTRKITSDDEEEDEQDKKVTKSKTKQSSKPPSSEEESNEEKQPSKPTKKVAQKKTRKITSDEEEEDEESDEEFSPKKITRRGRNATTKKKF